MMLREITQAGALQLVDGIAYDLGSANAGRKHEELGCVYRMIRVPIAGRAHAVKLGCQIRKPNSSQPLEQNDFGPLQRIVQRRVDHGFDSASRTTGGISDGEDGRAAKRPVDIQQCYLVQVAFDDPAAAMSLLRPDIAGAAQTGHGPSDNYRIRTEHVRDLVGRQLAGMPRHVQQHVQHSRQPGVYPHAQFPCL